MVRLNRAVAVAEADGPAAALAIVDGLDLAGYQYWHSTRAELLRRLGRAGEARAAYREALALARTIPERRFLERRIAETEETETEIDRVRDETETVVPGSCPLPSRPLVVPVTEGETMVLQTRRGAPAEGREAAPDWLMLAVLLLGQFMCLVDVMVVNVAVPSIAASLHASGASLQLVVGAYTIAYAMLLITGARLGDRYGRRRTYLAGVLVFTSASLACALAPDVQALIGFRLVQGVGAAVLVPQVFSIIQLTFAGPARARALSAYAAVLSAGAVAGLVLGGVVVTANLFGTSWRPVFAINVPLGIALALLVPRLVPADAPPAARDATRARHGARHGARPGVST